MNRRKIGYLVNQYPKVSHTFIRREISALEGRGYDVMRFSVRPPPEALPGAADQREQERTEVLLDAGVRGLLGATLRVGLRRPLALLSAAGLAARFGLGSGTKLWRHAAYLAEACALYERLDALEVGHLHAHFGTNSTTVAALTRALGGPPFSFTVHGPEEFDRADAIGLAEKVRRAAFVAAISSFGRSQLLRRAVSPDWPKIQVVRCGLDRDFLADEPSPVPAARRLTCVGRLCEQKGQLLLVEAAARLAAEGERFMLTLVGDGEMRAEVEQAILRHGLEGCVHITGFVDEGAVRAEIEASRGLVLPSFAEGLPVVLMEALARGRPVVTTYVAGIPELVEDGACGWLVPAGSVEHLAEAMRSLLRASPEDLTAMGRRGRERVLALHDAERNAGALASLMEEVAA